MSDKGTVLISGVNGFIASRTAESFLKAGYSVRGTVRSLNSGKALQDALSEYTASGKFELAEVPDITVDGAFDEAVQGVVAIAHMASPVSFFFTDPDPVIRTAVASTNSILNSALNKAGPQLKSVVFTSSIAAITSPRDPPYTYTEKDWNNFSEGEVKRLGKESPGPQIYLASKVGAERAFWRFREEHKPSFAMVSVNPGFVTGPPLVPPTDPKNINEAVVAVWTILSGTKLPPAMSPAKSYVDNRDVARLMVFFAEHPEKGNGERFIAIAGAPNEQAIADILNKHYPDLKLDKGTPGEGYLPDFTYPEGGIRVDSSKVVKATGQGWIGFEKSVLDAAKVFERYL